MVSRTWRPTKANPCPSFEQEPADVVDQAVLEFALPGDRVQAEEVQQIRVPGGLLGEIGVGGGQGTGEISDRLSGPVVQPGVDLMGQHVAAPPVLEGRCGIPFPLFRAVDLIEQREMVVPGQFCKRRLQNCFAWPGCGERPHVPQVPGRVTLGVGKPLTQVGRQPVDDLGAPPLVVLTVEDLPSDRPVPGQQLGVGGADRPTVSSRDVAGDRIEQIRVPVRQGGPLRRCDRNVDRRVRRFRLLSHDRSISVWSQPSAAADGRGAKVPSPAETIEQVAVPLAR